MLDETFQDRVEKLLAVRVAERRKQFPAELQQIDNKLNARGLLCSGTRLFQIHQAHERELENRATIVWESVVRVHRTLGSASLDKLRDDLKSFLRDQIGQIYDELSVSLLDCAKRTGRNVNLTLESALRQYVAKYEVEIDLYVDSPTVPATDTQANPIAQNYNFHGNVGSVQIGPNSVANVVQILGAEDRTLLVSALAKFEDTIRSIPNLVEQQRKELLEIAAKCKIQVNSPSPNSTRLLTMFNVLGTSIQTIASAQPAYLALKGVLLSLGIHLP